MNIISNFILILIQIIDNLIRIYNYKIKCIIIIQLLKKKKKMRKN